MKFTASHTINLGIAKVTLSRSGVTVSSGIPGLRFSVNTKGQAGVDAGIPGTGLHFRKKKSIKKLVGG